MCWEKNQESNLINYSLKNIQKTWNKLNQVKELYSKTYKIRKKLKKTVNVQKTSHAHALEKLILWQWVYYKKLSRFYAIFTEVPIVFFVEIDKTILKFL